MLAQKRAEVNRGSPTVIGFTGPGSVNPKVEKFWNTGDPAVFAKPGALDYQGD